MPVTGIHHLDLAVRDVERSVAFYLAVLGPLGAAEAVRYSTYRQSEEVADLRLAAGRTRRGAHAAPWSTL